MKITIRNILSIHSAGIFLIAAGVLLIILLFVGCASGPQRTAFNTIGAIDATATASINELFKEAINHEIPTNDVPEASLRYNQLHAALLIASVTAQNGTNALTPAALVQEASELGAFIITIEKK